MIEKTEHFFHTYVIINKISIYCLSFCHSLWNFSLEPLIFHMNISCDKTFPWVPLFFRSAVTPSVCPKILSSQLFWNYWSNYHETWYVDRTSYVVLHIGRKFWSPHPWNLENTHKWPCHRNSSETTVPISWNLVCR